ncbi:MAG: aldo/keto reductase family oxidoreductase [Clostridiales bacterium]|nr:aldo/keto reductase family oxidoreductase [Clostridiales bacterium]
MKFITLKNGLQVPQLALGCMRIAGKEQQQVNQLIAAAMDSGVTFFDHADIYGKGASEEKFAAAVKANGIARDKVTVQTKCGIRPGMYDFSREHIVSSVENSLKRLGTDYVDFLLLHRPDTLMEPEEVAEAFTALQKDGKVRYFGVSNFNAGQMALLQSALTQHLFFNQLQFGPAHTGMIDSGINANTRFDGALDRDGGILEYTRLNKVHIQAWSPFQWGMFQGLFWENPAYDELTRTLDRMAEEKGLTREGMVAAWVMRHPAGIQFIAGTTTPQRVRHMAEAADVTLSRAEWYEIYRAAGNQLP